MSKEGYLQTKIQELNEKIKTLEEKEKHLSIKYDKVESLLNNEVSIVLKDIEHIKKTEQEIKELPEKIFNYVKENIDEIIHIKFNKEWKIVESTLKNILLSQSKINAFEFNQMAKRYIADNMNFEVKLGAIENILLKKKIIDIEEFNRYSREYRKRVKPLIKKDMIVSKSIVTDDLKTIDKHLGTDFDSEELIRENKKILEKA